MIESETRERFIIDVVERLPGAEIVEGHFFAPRRVNGVEQGVAVVAARLPAEAPAVLVEEEPDAEQAGEVPAEDSPYAPEAESPRATPERYTVFTATYRHTLKGPDRGKWEVSVKAEADAPLVTVDQVVRGVQRRAEDSGEVDRLTGGEIQAVAATRSPAAG